MSEMKHTSEPWTLDAPCAYGQDLYGDGIWIGSVHNNHLGGADRPSDRSGFPSNDEGEANGRRIIACVNACRGIPTHELEAHGVLRLSTSDPSEESKE